MRTSSFHKIISFLSLLYLEVQACSVAQNNTQSDENECDKQLSNNNVECTRLSLFCPSGNYSDPETICYNFDDNGQPVCEQVPNGVLRCNDIGQVYILDCFCATYNKEDDEIEIGSCMLNCKHLNDYHPLPQNVSKLNQRMCVEEYNRSGSICGNCCPHMYQLAYSFDLVCVQCPNGKSGWWKLILYVFLPLTVFCLLVLVFQINAMSSYLHGLVIFSQAITDPVLARYIYLSTKKYNNQYFAAVKLIGSFYSIWNLDMFRFFNYNICLEISRLDLLIIDLAIGVYPLLFIVLTYFMIYLYDLNFKPMVAVWNPLHRFFNLVRKKLNIRTSVVHTLSTFYVLSYAKLLSACFDLLVPVQVHQLAAKEIKFHYRLYYDGSIPYFGELHRPYGILAILVLLIFVILPMLSILLYPFRLFQKCLNVVPCRWYILHTFMDSFQGYFKDGTEPGTLDCRWFASLFLLIRVILMTISGFSYTPMFFIYASIYLIIVAALIIIFRPFKLSQHTYISFIFIMLSAILYTNFSLQLTTTIKSISFSHFSYIIVLISTTLPILYVISLVVYCVIRKIGCR